MKFIAVIRVLLTLVGLFALVTKAQTTTLAIYQSAPDNSTPKKSSSDTTAKERLVLSRPAEMNDPPVETTHADLDAAVVKAHAQLQAQLDYLKVIVAAATRLSPAAAAMKEFINDMKRSDYLADRMAELGTESAYTYWRAVYGGKAGYESLQY